jgi:hypothetical protein
MITPRRCLGCGAGLARPGQAPGRFQLRYRGRGLCNGCYRDRDALEDADALFEVLTTEVVDPPVYLTPRQRGEAVCVLTLTGLSASAIASRLGLSERSVVRYRRRLRTVGRLAA